MEDEISKFIYDLETEDRLVRVGLKDTAETAKIYKKYKDLFTKENLEKIQNEINKLRRSSQQGRTITERLDILERIYYTLAGSHVGQVLAKAQDELTTYFSKATVKIGTETLAYFQIGPKIAKEPQFFRREQYDDAASKVVAKSNSKQLAILKREIALLKNLGFASYLDYFSKSKKMDYGKFATIVVKMLKDTDKIWVSVISKISQEVLGKPFKKIRSCHMAYLRSLSMYDNFYPEKLVVATFERWAGDIGLSSLLGRIEIDQVDRPRKNPRAVCYWPKPPDEVHLVIKPIGGEQDFEAMFHEGGHALHGVAIDPKLPYSLRTLAHSNALTETYAFLFEDLVFDPDFLTTYLNVSAFTDAKIKGQAYFVNLMMLRRYLGKFSYEYEMFAGLSKGRTLQQGPTSYKRNLDAVTGFVHRKENWLSDMDSGFYSAEYLRAWIAAAQIQDYLIKKFGKRWFANKKAGEFLRRLYSRGVQDEVEDVVKKLGYKPWDTSYLIRGYKQVRF